MLPLCKFSQHILHPGTLHRVPLQQRGYGPLHDIGAAHKVQHGNIIEIVTERYDLLRAHTQLPAQGSKARALVCAREIQLYAAFHGAPSVCAWLAAPSRQ